MELGADGPSNGQSSRISCGSNGAVTLEPVIAQDLLIIMRTILAATVSVMDTAYAPSLSH